MGRDAIGFPSGPYLAGATDFRWPRMHMGEILRLASLTDDFIVRHELYTSKH
jgi:hypothetical protein